MAKINYGRAEDLVNCVISSLDDLPESEFDELLNFDKRFESFFCK